VTSSWLRIISIAGKHRTRNKTKVIRTTLYMYYFEVASEVDNMEDRHGRDEKGLSDKDEGAASNYQQQRERRHHSSHRNKGHGHRSKTEKTRSRYSPLNNESIENERKIAGTVASPPPSYTVVGNNNARHHHDVDRNDNQGYPNGMQLFHVCLSLVLRSSFHHCMMYVIQ
jgi:hypothetical protein